MFPYLFHFPRNFFCDANGWINSILIHQEEQSRLEINERLVMDIGFVHDWPPDF